MLRAVLLKELSRSCLLFSIYVTFGLKWISKAGISIYDSVVLEIYLDHKFQLP